jgi:16S rRNA (adenine1518-N6/adenine1519-N6)-dimethyltransferase
MSRIKQKKSLGQIFLQNPWPCERIADELKKCGVTHALEIGPGGGVLTGILLEAGIAVTAVEMDERFAEALRTTFHGKPVEIIQGDFLEFGLQDWIDKRKKAGNTIAIVGNIPYYISSDIVLTTLSYLSKVTVAVFLVQLEFAQRIASPPGKKSYGSLSVFTQLRAEAKLMDKVGRNNFAPVPGVDSSLLKLTPRKIELSTEQLRKTEQVTRMAFGKRRKMLSNSLKALLIVEPKPVVSFDLNLRPDVLTPEDYVKLTQEIFATRPEPKAKDLSE